ncbi:glycosyltransferase family 4 protein [Allobaculum sp. JKK-2023]|uniref:glycosyltransferase family 4 protein n=1 Tax=Allobaculum sp. JKK-2023 TaxID=3108943 RepID=UPI002B05D006|nr:glycosyltransferase family 4 protein [Allobaculum sp. JKK-2023]
MKILIVNIYYFPNVVGGAENSIKLLAENLAKDNEVSVFCAATGISNKETINGVDVYRCRSDQYKLPHFNDVNLFEKVRNKLLELKNHSMIVEYLKIVDSFKPDIVHTNNLYGLSSELWKVTKEKGIPIVHTLRDYEIFNPLPNQIHISRIMSEYIKEKSKYVDILTAPSKYMVNYAKEASFFSNAKFEVIPNAVEVDIDEIRNIIDTRMLNDEPNVHYLYAGMLSKHKGLDILLRAFSQIHNDSIDLTICGAGKLEPLVKEYLKRDSRIKFRGQLGNEQLVGEYKSADVLIVPSQWNEPFGRVVIEGNKFGLPVIGSNKGGIKEIVDSIQGGILFQSESVEDLVNSIVYLSNRNNIKLYYNNILEKIQKYSIEKQVNSFVFLYRELLMKAEKI